jgi:hypothetical protein
VESQEFGPGPKISVSMPDGENKDLTWVLPLLERSCSSYSVMQLESSLNIAESLNITLNRLFFKNIKTGPETNLPSTMYGDASLHGLLKRNGEFESIPSKPIRLSFWEELPFLSVTFYKWLAIVLHGP